METATLASLILRHLPQDGMREVHDHGLGLIRYARATDRVPVLHRPAVCIIAQGAKVVTVGGEAHRYDASTHLVISVDLPLTGQVVQASPEQPYLCLRVDLDPALLSDVLVSQPLATGGGSARGLHLSRTTPELVDAAVRLLRLLDRPQDMTALAPLIRREIYYRLLTGDQAGVVRQIGTPDSRLAQVARAIGWIRQNFDSPFSIEVVALEAGMSASALHQHFRAVTTMSPLQYQKQIRLQEARRLMLSERGTPRRRDFRWGTKVPPSFHVSTPASSGRRRRAMRPGFAWAGRSRRRSSADDQCAYHACLRRRRTSARQDAMSGWGGERLVCDGPLAMVPHRDEGRSCAGRSAFLISLTPARCDAKTLRSIPGKMGLRGRGTLQKRFTISRNHGPAPQICSQADPTAARGRLVSSVPHRTALHPSRGGAMAADSSPQTGAGNVHQDHLSRGACR